MRYANTRSGNGRSLFITAVLCMASSLPATLLVAQIVDDPVLRSVEGIEISDRAGEKAPLDLVFRDQNGHQVRLGEIVDGSKPVVINFVYFACPMLCNLVFEGVVDSVEKSGLTLSEDFDVITMSIDPRDGFGDAHKRKKLLIGEYEERRELGGDGPSGEEIARGWHFLTGKEAQIRPFAEALGFEYRWNDFRGEYAHGAGIFLLTPEGTIARTLFGIAYEPQTFRLSLVEAADGKVGNALDRVLLLCFYYDPTLAQYGPAARNLMKLGGVVFVVILLIFLFRMRRQDRMRAQAVTVEPDNQ
ncbi:MAG TPA: SCO family protein [Planctomycetes bacterium]|nr:SCO family protein [Planctomycetota bacterium]HIN80276.1 SCO family protein [Planctomycetota bacterium]